MHCGSLRIKSALKGTLTLPKGTDITICLMATESGAVGIDRGAIRIEKGDRCCDSAAFSRGCQNFDSTALSR